MLSSIKKLFQKIFKSEPEQYEDNNIAPGTPKSGAFKPMFHPENETVLDEPSGKATNEDVAPPPYSPPLSSNHDASPRLATRPGEPSAVPQVEVHVGVGMGPAISVTASVSTPMWQSSAPMHRVPTSSDDSVSQSSDQMDSDSGSYLEDVKGNYRSENDGGSRPRAHKFQQSSPSGNREQSHSRHFMPGQENTSGNSAFGPGGVFDTVFGQGGTFDTVFGRGGTFDAAFGSSGTSQHQFNGGAAPHSTHYTHSNTHTHFSSASHNGGPSSRTHPNTRFDADDAGYWTDSYDDPTRNKGRHDFRREKGGSTRSRGCDPGFQQNSRPSPTNQDTHRQEGPFAPFFGGSSNISINACNINMFTTYGNTTIHTTTSSSRASPQFQSGGRGTPSRWDV